MQSIILQIFCHILQKEQCSLTLYLFIFFFKSSLYCNSPNYFSLLMVFLSRFPDQGFSLALLTSVGNEASY